MGDAYLHARRPLHNRGENVERENGKVEKVDTPTTGAKRRSVLILAVIVILVTSIMYKTYSAFPNMDEFYTEKTQIFEHCDLLYPGILEDFNIPDYTRIAIIITSMPNNSINREERSHVKLPRNMNDARSLGLVLTKYKEDHYPQVLSAVVVTYICLQTFAIPGSIFLTILSGFLFPTVTAMTLVCSCSAIGATLCYALSYLVGTNLVEYMLAKYVKTLRELVDKHREHMLNYILFLRITPFVPNWLINIASPVVKVDLLPFSIGTFLGVAPPSYFFIQAGTTLNELTDNVNNFSIGKVSFLAALAILSLLPVIFKRKLKRFVE